MRRLNLLLARFPVALRHALAYAGGLAVAKAVSFMMVPVFTHNLSPADYGRLDVLQTLADLFSVVIGLGLADTLFRFAGSAADAAERRQIARSLYGFSVFSGLFFLGIVQIFAPLIHAYLPGGVGLLETRLILASLSFSAIILVPLGWFRLTDRPGRYFFGTAGRAILQASIAAILLSVGMGVPGVILAGLISCLTLMAVLSVLFTRDVGLNMRPGSWGGFALYGGPLVLSGIAMFFLGSCDRWILASVLGPEALAPYAVAAKFALITAMLLQPFEMWWFSKRFSILTGPDGKTRAARTAEVGLALVCVAVLAVSAIGPWLIHNMTPVAYHEATLYLPWLCALAGLRAATNLLNLGLYADRTTWRILSIEGSAALLAVCLLTVLIPEYGALGAIAASAVALLFRLLITFRLSQKRQALTYRPQRLIVLLGASLCSLFFVATAESPTAQLFVGTAASSGMLLLAYVLRLVPRSWFLFNRAVGREAAIG